MGFNSGFKGLKAENFPNSWRLKLRNSYFLLVSLK